MELEKGGKTVREILFRGICLRDIDFDEIGEGTAKAGEFAYGQVVLNASEAYIVGTVIEATDEYIAPEYWIPVDPETVGEYAGLCDKNKNPAYEGDIIKSNYANTPRTDLIEKIVFHNGKFAAEYSISGNSRTWAPLADGIRHASFDKSVYMTEFEIIGNIHENPELLEATSE